jgi:predicted enzyme related to lactoylglutathione lyase
MNKLAHFDIHSADTEKAKAFYENVFDWKCSSYAGAEEFCQITAADGSVIGAISGRRYNPDSKEIYGFECSVTVDDVEETIRAVEAAGGKTLMPKTAIPHVGWVAKFLDPEGNLFAAITYDQTAS